jgi:hypothetical protein
MRWAGHVACMEAMKNTQKIFLGKPEEKRRDCTECLGINGRMIFKWTLSNYGCRVLIGFFWLKIGTLENMVINLLVP